MKRHLARFGFIPAIFGMLFACATTGTKEDAIVDGVDSLIELISEKTVNMLEEGSALAVYYFTLEGEISGISEYLINDLTTTIANMGKSKIKVVSRQTLDRILTEHAFQMSDLADRENQVLVGKQLGAELILTGFITPVSDLFKLNIQLIEVATGVVKGGFILDFRPEKDFEKKIASSDGEQLSETVKVEEKVVTRGGVATLTTIFETFDEVITGIQLSRYEDYWGDNFSSVESSIGIDEKGSQDGSACALFSLQGKAGLDNVMEWWDDSYLTYYFDLKIPWDHSEFDGVHLSLKLVDFSFAEVFIKQMIDDEELIFALQIYLTPGEWYDLRIPFYNFYSIDDDYEIDPGEPLTLSIVVPYHENYLHYHFREVGGFKGKVLVDNIGFFNTKGVDDDSLLGTFDDELLRMAPVPELYGTTFHWDYSENDEGEFKKTKGFKSQSIVLSENTDGPAGNYLSLSAHLEITEELRDFIEGEQSIALYLRARAGKSWEEYEALGFFIRSNILDHGEIEAVDAFYDSYYYADFNISSLWTKINIPFSRFEGDRKPLSNSREGIRKPEITICFEIPNGILKKAISNGRLDITLDLDEIVLAR
jgi:TolB-like protein